MHLKENRQGENRQRRTTLVLGIGNLLLRDDSVGVHAVRYLQQTTPEEFGLRCVDVGTLSFTLAEMIEEAPRLIVVDAARMGDVPGTVRSFQDADLDRFLRKPRQSMHEVGLPDLFDMARLRDCLPTRRAMVAIQPRRIEVGEAITPEVAQAIPEAARMVREIARQWDEEAV